MFGVTEAEHNERLYAVLEIGRLKGLKLNRSKCLFKQDEVPFVGNIISSGGVKSDLDKVAAICNLPASQNETELRSFWAWKAHRWVVNADEADK